MEEKKSLRKKRSRELARRRKGLDEGNEDDINFQGLRGFWEKFGTVSYTHLTLPTKA